MLLAAFWHTADITQTVSEHLRLTQERVKTQVQLTPNSSVQHFAGKSCTESGPHDGSSQLPLVTCIMSRAARGHSNVKIPTNNCQPFICFLSSEMPDVNSTFSVLCWFKKAQTWSWINGSISMMGLGENFLPNFKSDNKLQYLTRQTNSKRYFQQQIQQIWISVPSHVQLWFTIVDPWHETSLEFKLMYKCLFITSVGVTHNPFKKAFIPCF